MKQVFEGDLDIERLVLSISAETGVSIEAENTLIIFDEVQEVPKALTSLKYFYENAPQYAIVAAESLLGVLICIRLISGNFCAQWERNNLFPC